MSEAAHLSLSLVGQPYDFQFEPANVAWYCSEIPWWCYSQIVPNSPWVTRRTMDVLTVTPQDYFNAKDKWDVVLASKDFENG